MIQKKELHFDGLYYIDTPDKNKQKYENVFRQYLETIWTNDNYYLFLSKKDLNILTSPEAVQVDNDWTLEKTQNIHLTAIIIRNILYLNTSASNVAIYLIAMHKSNPLDSILASLNNEPKWKPLIVSAVKDVIVAFEDKWINDIVIKNGGVIRKDYDGNGLDVYGYGKSFPLLDKVWL